MKKLWILAALVFALTLAAATTGDYLFKLNIDEATKDLSGNERHPLNFFTESDHYKGDREGILFRRADSVLKLPVSAFALPQGSVEMTVRLADATKNQILMLRYSPKGDNFLIGVSKGRLQASYYHRAAKKWYAVTDYKRVLRSNVWHVIRVTYQFPGEIALYADGKTIGKTKVDSQFTPGTKTVLLLGNDQVNQRAMLNGVIHRATFTDTPEAPKAAENAALKRTVSAETKVGKFDLQWEKAESGIALLGMRFGKTEFLSPLRREPVWRIRLYNAKTKEYAVVDSLGSAGTIAENQIAWSKVALPDGTAFPVTLKFSAVPEDGIDWRLETGDVPAGWAVDTVVYPILALAPTSVDPQEMYLTYPAFCGRNKRDPFTFAKPQPGMRFGNAYGSGAHFQFCFLYGKDQTGLYLMTPDATGYLKDFLFTAFPEDKALVFTLEQFPEQRAISTNFKAPYPVHTGALKGDWYDAAKRYRKWAIRQKWCAQGTLEKRTDQPQWLRNCDLSARPALKANCHNAQKIKEDLTAISQQSDFLSEKFPTEILNPWYTYKRGISPEATTVGLKNKWSSSALNGHWQVENVPGVQEVLKKLSQQRFHTLGYINSIIYDQPLDLENAENKAILPSVTRNLDGSLFLYGNLLYYCCRGDEAWQRQLLRIIERDSLALGFDGMYLDSFGRGYNFCYATNHGHKPGASCGSLQGQLKMAQLIRPAMQKAIPGFVLSSEASIEQFVGVIDLKLHHYNVHTESVPVWAAIYHDYQYVYGRYASQPEISTTAIFHMGGILGRVFTGQQGFDKTYFKTPEIVAYTGSLIALRQKFRRSIGMGEMLRPPVVKCSEPDRKVSLKKMKVTVPAIQGSAWKESGGGITLFFTNCTDKPLEFAFELQGSEFDAYRSNAWKAVVPGVQGAFSEKPYQAGSKLVLPPLSALAIDLGAPAK